MPRTKQFNLQYSPGFSLVDIMVGLFIGALILLAVYGSMIFFDATKRSAVSGNSAFANAINGLYMIGYDIKNAGLGLRINQSIYCSQFNIYYQNSVKANNRFISPIMILEGGGNPDQISVMYSDSIYSAAASKFLSNMSTYSSPIQVNNSVKSLLGNQILLASNNTNQPCTLMGVTDLVDNGGLSTAVSHDSSSPFNPADQATVFTNPITYTSDGYIIPIQSLHWLTWRVQNGVLQVVDELTGQIQAIADNIIELQAQYGISNTGSSTIAQWVNAGCTSSAGCVSNCQANCEWQNLDNAHVQRIRAIRVAVIARSPQKEKPHIAGGACDATTQAPLPWTGAARVDITEDPDWRCYRYVVLKTVYMLNNLVWGQSS
jgi:type IV pilus assembly protein PilW